MNRKVLLTEKEALHIFSYVLCANVQRIESNVFVMSETCLRCHLWCHNIPLQNIHSYLITYFTDIAHCDWFVLIRSVANKYKVVFSGYIDRR
jgi:hypothetical protein